ncbi:MAG TPA: winged helix-turn-helix transcriptional regulator [Ktedonobacteraceae bacterium]|nr:winged helix-turn-helix transcriptional regulator [Ktedonobacteraceae bacterium]
MPRAKKTSICPIGGSGVGGKWMFWITYHLLSGPKRFGELQRLLPQASRQMLTIQLRELEHVGMIHRHAYAVTPPKVEYQLSELGKTSEPILRHLSIWGQWYSERQGGSADWLVSLGSTWKIGIWHHLLNGPKRFGALQHLLPGVSRRMLTRELHELEQMGIVQRQASLQTDSKREYALTPLGQNAAPVLHELSSWGRWTCEQLGLEYDWSIIDQAEERYFQAGKEEKHS